MRSFTHYLPTEIVFGKDTELETGKKVKKWGGSRVLIVYGGGSVVNSGLLKRVEDTLVEEGIVYTEFGGVKPNPVMSYAWKGVEEAKEFEADFILAVGGGSVIDTAKGIALAVANPEATLEDLWGGKIKIEKSLPTGCVLTIAAAGSETSDVAVLTNEKTGIKKGCSSEHNRPRFAIMNPELTYTLPKYQLACGIVDIMMHTLDRYFTPVQGNKTSDALAEAVLRMTIENGYKAMKDQTDYDCMSEIMWCGSLSHNGLTGLGCAREFAVHKFGHELSVVFDVAHGASLSSTWGAWAKYVVMTDPARFAQYARNVWDVTEDNDVDAALLGIQKTVEYFEFLGMPVCLGDMELPGGQGKVGTLTEEQLELLADKITRGNTIKVSTLHPMDKEQTLTVYRMANTKDYLEA